MKGIELNSQTSKITKAAQVHGFRCKLIYALMIHILTNGEDRTKGKRVPDASRQTSAV